MPSVQPTGFRQFASGLSAWLLIVIMLVAGSGTVIHSVAPGSPGPRLVADADTYACGSDHYHYQKGGQVCDCENHPGCYGCVDSPCDSDRRLCGSCPNGCEAPNTDCGPCGNSVSVSTSVRGMVVSGPSPSTTHPGPCASDYRGSTPQLHNYYRSGGFYPDIGTPSDTGSCGSSAIKSPCAKTTPCMDYKLCSSWRNYYSWSYTFFIKGDDPLQHPYGVWYDNPFRFAGTSHFAQFALPAPIRAVDPNNYEIYWNLKNTHGLDIIMQLDLEAPGHMDLQVVGVGGITDVTPHKGQFSWVFTLPAYHSPDTGVYITVKDPSDVQHSYILVGEAYPLQSA